MRLAASLAKESGPWALAGSAAAADPGGVSYERLSAQDTVFLRIENERQPQHVGSLSIYDSAPWRDDDGRLRIDELRAFVKSRLHLVPRLRQKLMFVPYGQGRPVWVDDEDFDIAFHVRLTALPRPGDDRQLLELMSRLQSLPLDRDRPLWEIWFVDGLDNDRGAMVIKTHHALGDGIANVDLGLALLDVTEEPDESRVSTKPWSPKPPPSPTQLWASSVTEQATKPFQLWQAGMRALRSPRAAWSSTANVGRTLWTMAERPDPAPWNTAVTTHRRWRWASVDLKVAREVKSAAAVTLNDVVVSGCTLALRRFLLDHDEEVEDRTLKAMVPVSTRQEDQHGATLGNKVSMFMVDLPVGEADIAAVLDGIHRQTDELKQSGLIDGADAVIRIADAVTPIAAPLTRFVSRSIPMNLVVTNIPGPPLPLWFWGAPLLEVYPYVEVVDNEGLTMAVLSYNDKLFFGITSDRDVVPDLGSLAKHLADALDDIAEEILPPTG